MNKPNFYHILLSS